MKIVRGRSHRCFRPAPARGIAAACAAVFAMAVAVTPGAYAGGPEPGTAGQSAPFPKSASIAADSMTFDTTSRRLALEPNRPNPFPVSTTIAYAIPSDGHVKLEIRDFLFREVQTVVDENQTAGRHEVVWPNAETPWNLSSGMYFCTLTTSGGVQQLRMLLMK